MPSSVVAHMTYSAETRTLRIVFVSGMIYEYIEVPESVFREMRSASSKGTFLNTKIKGHYSYRKIS